MKTLNETQIMKVIDHLYPVAKYPFDNQALINIFFNDWSVYKAEAHGGQSKNTLIKKVRRVNAMISFIETL
jgi:hypothetical protein